MHILWRILFITLSLFVTLNILEIKGNNVDQGEDEEEAGETAEENKVDFGRGVESRKVCPALKKKILEIGRKIRGKESENGNYPTSWKHEIQSDMKIVG